MLFQLLIINNSSPFYFDNQLIKLKIMDYKEKYEQALEWMQSLYSGLHGATKEEAEHYFPELKEDNDERIRKGLIKAVSRIFEGHKLFDTDVTREEALAWLEKQDKTLDADKVIEW